MPVNIRDIVALHLRRCNIPYEVPVPDVKLQAACLNYAKSHGYEIGGQKTLGPCIPGGVVMASNAFGHIADLPTRVIIGIYTAFMIYLDDISSSDIEAVAQFNQRFYRAEPQLDKVLDDFAQLLREFPDYFCTAGSDMIVTSTLNFVTSLFMDVETEGMDVSWTQYPTDRFARILNGAALAYTLLAFPKSLPISSYIQAVPEINVYVENTNDVLSFYKEQMAGDDINYASLLSHSYSVTKYEALIHLSNVAVDANERILRLLEPVPEALEAYTRFRNGYVRFHTGLGGRYKLAELKLTNISDYQDRLGAHVNHTACKVCQRNLCN